MVKNKKKEYELAIWEFAKSIYDFKTFTKKYSLKHLALYVVALTSILIILGIVNSKYSTYALTWSSILIGLPLFFLIMFTFFFVFIKSFDDNKEKKFWESFLVFMAVILPLIIVGNLLGSLTLKIASTFLSSIILFLVFILFSWLLVSLVVNFKNYYKTTGYVIIASLILAIPMFIGFISVFIPY